MKIALLFPPMGSITHPYLSLPSLTAFLRLHGHEVLQKDVGVHAINTILTPEYLEELQHIITNKLSSKDTGIKSVHFEQLHKASIFAPHVIKNITSVKDVLRSKEKFYDTNLYLYATNIVRRAFDIISAAYYPTKLIFNDINFGRRIGLLDIYKYTFNEERNPFLKVMSHFVEYCISKDTTLVGISITYYSQIICGYTLARFVKKFLPNAHVVIGGAAITCAENRLRSNPNAFDFVDGYVFGEGEKALLDFIQVTDSGYTIPPTSQNLYIKNKRRDIGGSENAHATSPERIKFDSLPTPDYAGLNLQDYLAPHIVFLLSNSRGCYYRKCNFCTVSLAFNNGFQERAITTLCNDIKNLVDKYNAKYLFFSDDCVSPKRCLQISEFIKNSDSPIYWQTEIRFEKAFTLENLRTMYEGGCRQLMFGNESGNQRVLNLMNKKTDLYRNKTIICNTARANIAVHLQNFLGFPGETIKEAADTINFLISHSSYITSWALGIYHITEYSPVHRNLKSFGITWVRRHSRNDIIPHFYYKCEGAIRKEIRQFHNSSLMRLKRVFSRQDNFLDGVCGAHAFLMMTNFKKNKFEKIYLTNFFNLHIFKKKPSISNQIIITKLHGGKMLIYNNRNAHFLSLNKRDACFFSMLDGILTVEDICKETHQRKSQNNGSSIIDMSSGIILLLYDLVNYGFVEFVKTDKSHKNRKEELKQCQDQ